MDVENKTLRICSKELFATLCTFAFFMCNILYPVWILPGNPWISIFLLFSFVIFTGIIFAISYSIFPHHELYLSKKNFHSLIGFMSTWLRNKRKVLIFLIGGYFFYFIFMLPSLLADFTPSGDAGAHVYRIIFFLDVFMLSGKNKWLFSNLWLIVLTIIILLFFIIIVLSSFNVIPRLKKFSSEKQPQFIICIISLLFFIILIILLLTDFYYNSTSLTELNRRGLLVRYPPIAHSIGMIILSIFPWQTLPLKMVIFIIMILASFFLRSIFLELLESFHYEKTYLTEFFSFSCIFSFLFFPIVIQYSTFFYLASGLAFFLLLTTWLLIRFLKTKKDEYLFTLIITAGVSVMWERAILFHILGVLIILIFYILIHRRSIQKKNILSYIFCAIVSMIIFFPINILALYPEFKETAASSALRSFSDFDFTNLVKSQLFDYLIRAEIEMGVIGWLCYAGLALLFILALMKKDLALSSIFILFCVSYVPYIMDTAWKHEVDRFMIPILGLLSVSLYLILFWLVNGLTNSSVYVKSIIKVTWYQNKAVSQGIIKVIISGCLIGVLFLTGITTAIHAQNKLLYESYLPLSSMSAYLKEITTENDIIYYNALVTPLWFYFNTYDVKAKITQKVWTEVPNQTVENMLIYFVDTNVTYFIFSDPDSWLCGLFNPSMVQELIDYPHTGNYSLLTEKKAGRNSLYLWKVL
ncbi:MAG: hypothetical protein ACFE8U_16935 [Candidatus Hermodarchaeota archaeon]